MEDAATTASRIQSIEVLAVETDPRGNERALSMAAVLFDAGFERASSEFDTEVVLAKIAADDHELVQRYMRQDFDVCRPGQSLQIDGTEPPSSSGYLDAWKVLSRELNIRVTLGAAS